MPRDSSRAITTANTITVPSRRYGPRIFYRIGTRRGTALVLWQGACVVCGGDYEVLASSGKSLGVTCQKHRGVVKGGRGLPWGVWPVTDVANSTRRR
jgi:hypothetical protein